MCLRDKARLKPRNGAQIYLHTHADYFWPQITQAHVSVRSLNPQLRTRGGRICPQCGELLRTRGNDWSEGSRGQDSRKRGLLRENPASLSESLWPERPSHWHTWRRRGFNQVQSPRERIMQSVFLINYRCFKTRFFDFDFAVSKLFHLICKMDLIIIQKF